MVKGTHRVAALLVITTLMVAIVAMSGASAAFGQTFAESAAGLTDAHAEAVEAHIGG